MATKRHTPKEISSTQWEAEVLLAQGRRAPPWPKSNDAVEM